MTGMAPRVPRGAFFMANNPESPKTWEWKLIISVC